MQQTMLMVADRIGQALTAIADGAKSQRQQGWDRKFKIDRKLVTLSGEDDDSILIQ